MAGFVTKIGSGSAGLRFLSVLVALAPAPACAGAWIAPEDGQSISTEIAGQREEAFYSESTLYIEKPLNSGASFVASTWVTLDDTQYGFDAMRWEVTLAGKAAVIRTPRSVMALQAGAIWYSDPAADCGEAGAEVRWLGGVTLGRGGFANVEAAERRTAHECGGQRLDVTLGYRHSNQWLSMAQVFVDEPRRGEGTLKAQISGVWFGREGKGVQFGLRGRLDGDDLEPAFVLGFWGRP